MTHRSSYERSNARLRSWFGGVSIWRPFSYIFCLFPLGCIPYPIDSDAFRDAQNSAPFVQRRLEDAWISAAEAKMVLQRSFGPFTEQRILLTNKTAVRGDNMALLRAHRTDLASAGRLRPEKILQATDATFPPFADFAALIFTSRVDILGVLNWTAWSNNAGLNCILAFRRLDGASRILPAGAGVVDMVLRNCVYGSVEDALAPALPKNAGFSAANQGPGHAPQMLSPLAGALP